MSNDDISELKDRLFRMGRAVENDRRDLRRVREERDDAVAVVAGLRAEVRQAKRRLEDLAIAMRGAMHNGHVTTFCYNNADTGCVKPCADIRAALEGLDT